MFTKWTINEYKSYLRNEAVHRIIFGHGSSALRGAPLVRGSNTENNSLNSQEKYLIGVNLRNKLELEQIAQQPSRGDGIPFQSVELIGLRPRGEGRQHPTS